MLTSILFIFVCSLAMRIKGADWYWKGEKLSTFLYIPFKEWSSILVGIVVAIFMGWKLGIIVSIAWLFGIMPGLPALGKLKNNTKKIWIQTSLRGLLNGVLLSATFSFAVFPILAGLTMPIWYKLGFLLEDRFPNIFKKRSHLGGWALGEWFFGAILGFSLYLSM